MTLHCSHRELGLSLRWLRDRKDKFVNMSFPAMCQLHKGLFFLLESSVRWQITFTESLANSNIASLRMGKLLFKCVLN